MRKILSALLAAALTLPAIAPAAGPKFSTSGGVGSANSTFVGGEPNGGTYSINGTTGTVSTPIVNLRPGSAPASPSNGDCWTTVAGLFCRINGTTVGPYQSSAGAGTVTQVGLVTPSIFTAGGAVTTNGNLSFTLNSQSANQVFAGPNGSSGTPAFRALVGADIPAINVGASGNGGVTGTLGIANGGTGGTTALAARNALGLGTAATQNTGTSGATVPLLNGANTFGTSQTIDGNLTLSGTTASRVVDIRADAGQQRSVRFFSGASTRWTMGASNGAESGSDAGSNFFIQRFSDAGAFLDQPVSILRSTGAMSLTVPLAVGSGGTGANTVSGARTALGLGTAATQNTGTSGATVPLLNAANTWSADQTFGLGLKLDRVGAATGAQMRVNVDAGQQAGVDVQTAGSTRWRFGKDGASEAGSNAGSDFQLLRYNDAGTSLGSALTVSRATGAATWGGSHTFNAPSVSDLTYGSSYPTNAVKIGTANTIAYCPELSCVPVTTGNVVHHSTSALFSAISNYDSQAQEDTIAIHTTVDKSFKTAMARSTAYAVGANAYVGNAVYRATTAGTTAASSPPPGTRPASFPFTYVDGGVTWLWVNDFYATAKTGIYNETIIRPGGGASWSQANNYQMMAGATPSDNINLELDFTNNSGTDCAVGTTNCNGLLIVMGGTNSSTSAINVVGGNGVLPGSGTSHWGMRLNGTMLTSGVDVDIAAQNGIRFGGLLPATFTSAAILDNSTAPVGVIVDGNKSFADFQSAGTTPIGLSLNGTYSGAQISGTGFSVSPFGDVQAQSMKLASVLFSQLPTCNAGYEGTVFYVRDSNSATFNATMAGGGSNRVMALCNGSNWTVH